MEIILKKFTIAEENQGPKTVTIFSPDRARRRINCANIREAEAAAEGSNMKIFASLL